MDDVIVTIEHVRKARFCLAACRKWFPQHDLSWSDFVAHGIPARTLEATGDGLALVVVSIARAGK